MSFAGGAQGTFYVEMVVVVITGVAFLILSTHFTDRWLQKLRLDDSIASIDWMEQL